MLSIETIYLSDFLELIDTDFVKYIAAKFNVSLIYSSGGVKTRADVEVDILKHIAAKLEEHNYVT